MKPYKDLYSLLSTKPLVVDLTSVSKLSATRCTGLIYLSSDNKLQIDHFLNTDHSVLTDTFLSTRDKYELKVVLPGEMSASYTELRRNPPDQAPISYSYILFATDKDVVGNEAFTELVLVYPLFFINTDSVDNGHLATITLPDARLKYSIGSSTRWKRFPPLGYTISDRVYFRFIFNEPTGVNAALRYEAILQQYLAPYLRKTAEPTEILLGIPGDAGRPKYCAYISADASITDTTTLTIDESHLIDHEQQGRYFSSHLGQYFKCFDKIQEAAILLAIYWDYNYRKMYLDTKLSVLLAAIESFYQNCLGYEVEGRSERESQYGLFLEKIKDGITQIDNIKIRKFLHSKGVKHSFIDQRTYGEKLKIVSDYAEVKLPEGYTDRANKLRNDLMHGRLPNWSEYLRSNIDKRLGINADKLDAGLLAYILATAIHRYIANRSGLN